MRRHEEGEERSCRRTTVVTQRRHRTHPAPGTGRCSPGPPTRSTAPRAPWSCSSVWAERAEGTTWHPHHIAERYGLFTLIVLGESVTAAGLAVRGALDTGEALGSVLTIALGGILTVFALWWLYFAQDAPRRLRTQATTMLWGYGHYMVFAAAAAVGAALAVNVAHATHHTGLSGVQAAATYTVPVALFIACVWLLHRRVAQPSLKADVLSPVAALAVLATTFTTFAVPATGIVATLLIGAHLVAARRDAVAP
ncbi:low temperature requirement protein A [Streptomyces pseudogriseolus]|uniref:low temperature requirement protein A n=1 Tax=Streptomyces pseudogriseolus TaxID=36817 RepID=UPI003FA2C6F8